MYTCQLELHVDHIEIRVGRGLSFQANICLCKTTTPICLRATIRYRFSERGDIWAWVIRRGVTLNSDELRPERVNSLVDWVATLTTTFLHNFFIKSLTFSWKKWMEILYKVQKFSFESQNFIRYIVRWKKVPSFSHFELKNQYPLPFTTRSWSTFYENFFFSAVTPL